MSTKIKNPKSTPNSTVKPAIYKDGRLEYVRNGEAASAIKPHPPKKK